MSSETKKPHINIAFIGHVDAGKSTTMGHFIYKCGAVDRSVVQRLAKESKRDYKPTYKYAWLLDKLQVERDRTMSIDVSMWQLETDRFNMTLLDAPGHRDYIKNMISGTQQADCVVLIVDAEENEYERGMCTGTGQTSEHLLLAYTLGVRQLIVCINKMDKTTPLAYSEQRFVEIKTKLNKYIETIGFDIAAVAFIPISGWYGDNLIKHSDSNMSWFKGWSIKRKDVILDGKTIYDAINALETPKRSTNNCLRLPLQNVYSIKRIGTIAVGRVESGILKSNSNLYFAPANIIAQVKTIEQHHQRLKEALPGDIVGFNLRKISASDLQRGFVAGYVDNNPPRCAIDFIAQIIVLKHPGKISVGYMPVVDCHTTHITCKFVEIQAKIDRQTGEVVEKFPAHIKSGDAAIVKLVPEKPMCVERFEDFSSLGRFVIRDMSCCVAVGIIKSVNFKNFMSCGEK